MTLLEAVGIRCSDLMACLVCIHMSANIEGYVVSSWGRLSSNCKFCTQCKHAYAAGSLQQESGVSEPYVVSSNRGSSLLVCTPATAAAAHRHWLAQHLAGWHSNLHAVVKHRHITCIQYVVAVNTTDRQGSLWLTALHD
jgi:hypothetical protein